MAFENICAQAVGLKAAADLSAAQYKFVKVTAAESVNVATTLGEIVAGVLQNNPTLGAGADVAIDGSTSKVLAGAAVAAGANVTADATARAVTAASGQNVAGIAVTAASAAGQLITVVLGNKGNLA